ncbi:hypothetical protein ZOD2009_10580 [Haladaptatus paucihalophilus DX253]|uniref:Uncharacterized protein n=1 Tax=Haladaptatus paucihalophilus DX253 TaxID=797209 RepID=E7QTI8_HALPU|nr:hypothetical protein [Haladaptatus paucihalophilus]EFW91917.1 hypothetical protein ZOD2009_10580 [Haladaptatus paucihalophilus DX253]SHK83009.1 hypothetical protein SAMN05444342_2318 [Haladaptatus paucihalophilus DX253]
MNWKPAGIALLTAMILVAGCLGGHAGTTNVASDTTTQTASSTTTATTTTETTISPADADLPPGVTTDGISDVDALVSAHESALRETGFQFEARQTSRADGNTTVAVQHGRATAGLSTVFTRLNMTGNFHYRSTVWKNDSTVISRGTSEEGTRYRIRPREERGVAKSNTIRSILHTGEFAIDHVASVDDGTRITLHADRFSGNGGFENVTDYDATLVVDSAGRVHRFHRFIETDGRTRSIDFEFLAARSDAIDRPEWTDEAGRAVHADLRTTTDSGRLEIEHRGGDALPAGSSIELGHNGTTYAATFEHALEPGETAYFYFPSDGGDPMLTRTDPGRDAGTRFEGSYSLTIVTASDVIVQSSGFSVGYDESSAP